MILAARRRNTRAIALPPLLLATIAAAGLFLNHFLSGWLLMWTLAAFVFFLFKAISLVRIDPQPGWRKVALYIALWPNMNAEVYLRQTESTKKPEWRQWLHAIIGTGVGAFALFGLTPIIHVHSSLLAGWLGFGGLICLLHFGLFSLMALVWQHTGRSATPIMNAPQKSQSVSEFWTRWNLAFYQISQPYVFKPAAIAYGVRTGMFVAFLFSGLLHELIISFPAAGGFGLPTVYFLIQWAAIIFERSSAGRSILTGAVQRLFAVIIVIGPVPLLFHEPFINRVIIPFVQAIGAL